MVTFGSLVAVAADNVRRMVVLPRTLDEWVRAEGRRKGLNSSSYIRFVLASMRDRQEQKEGAS